VHLPFSPYSSETRYTGFPSNATSTATENTRPLRPVSHTTKLLRIGPLWHLYSLPNTAVICAAIAVNRRISSSGYPSRTVCPAARFGRSTPVGAAFHVSAPTHASRKCPPRKKRQSERRKARPHSYAESSSLPLPLRTPATVIAYPLQHR